jgi:histidinol-phosphatase
VTNVPENAADDLLLARALADTADAISLPRFGAGDLHVDAKPDLTPVTDADLAVERAIRDTLSTLRPDDAVLGEEFAGGDPARGRCWVIDPIDGTKNYVRGVPIWATLIALLVDGHPTVGVVSAPALARRWWGADRLGAQTTFAEGPERACHVSGVTALADASLSLSEPGEWEAAGLGPQVLELSRRCWRTRGYGDFYSYMLLAEGAVDIATEPELSLWDVAALVPIVTAAGGTITELDGTPIGPAGHSALATNGPLHGAVLEALGPDDGARKRS